MGIRIHSDNKKAGKRYRVIKRYSVIKVTPVRQEPKTLGPELSAELVSLLMTKEEISMEQIASFLRKTVEFVDQVVKKEQSLSYEDLVNLEKETNQPVLLSLLQSMKAKEPPQEDKGPFGKLHAIVEKLLCSTSKLRRISRDHP
jgi:hypothetical protein